MGATLSGVVVLTLVNWSLLWAAWRRNVVRKLHEPGLVNSELLRLLANAYAAAKLMLDACPGSDVSGLCSRRRNALSVAVAAVDEFGSTGTALPSE